MILLVACAPKAPVATVDALESPLAAADAQWAQRGTLGMAPALAAYGDLLGVADRRVWERLARAYTTSGLVETDPKTARDHLELGRGYAMSCLLTWPAFATAIAVDGWRVGPDAVLTLDEGAAPCLAWGAASSLLLVSLRGEGGALEVEQAHPLAERALVLAPHGEHGVVAWAAGLALLHRGEAQRTLARQLLERAVAENPGNLTFYGALVQAFPDAAAGAWPAGSAEFSLENAAARRRGLGPGAAGEE